MNDLGLRDYLQVLRRRKWIVLLAVIAVPAAAVALSLRQSPLYQASADVLLRYQSLPSTLTGISDPNSYAYYIDPTRSTDTSLQVANLPLLTNRVVADLQRRHIPATDISSTGVAEVGDTDVLRFTAQSPRSAVAGVIATDYAQQFTRYYQQLDTSSITHAISALQTRITTLQAQGTRQATSEATSLQPKVDQLQTLQTLQTSNAILIRQAATSAKVRPTPKKFGVIGLGLGFILGIGLAFLRDILDTRLRSSDDVAKVLKLPVLARIPSPPKRLERERGLVMLHAPLSAGADAFRRLRMNLEFVSIGKPTQVTMFSSALSGEGKSTTVANLGVAMALAGKSVALVDLDLRLPTLATSFGVDDRSTGLTSVVLGHVDLDEALRPIALAGEEGLNGRAAMSRPGSLLLLPSGPLPPDPGEFVGLEGVGRVVASLRERVDVILLDAPPLLVVGDALTIAGWADALVVVVRAGSARRPIAAELGATLSRLPSVKLGFILCGDTFDTEAYEGYGRYAYKTRTEPAKSEAIR